MDAWRRQDHLFEVLGELAAAGRVRQVGGG